MLRRLVHARVPALVFGAKVDVDGAEAKLRESFSSVRRQTVYVRRPEHAESALFGERAAACVGVDACWVGRHPNYASIDAQELPRAGSLPVTLCDLWRSRLTNVGDGVVAAFVGDVAAGVYLARSLLPLPSIIVGAVARKTTKADWRVAVDRAARDPVPEVLHHSLRERIRDAMADGVPSWVHLESDSLQATMDRAEALEEERERKRRRNREQAKERQKEKDKKAKEEAAAAALVGTQATVPAPVKD